MMILICCSLIISDVEHPSLYFFFLFFFLVGVGVGVGWGRSQSEAGLTELAAPRGCPVPSTSLPSALWLVTLQ